MAGFYMIWAGLACLTNFIGSLVWTDNAIKKRQSNDLTAIRVTMATPMGNPVALLCMKRRLRQIACVKAVSISDAKNRRAALINALVYMLFPSLTSPYNTSSEAVSTSTIRTNRLRTTSSPPRVLPSPPTIWSTLICLSAARSPPLCISSRLRSSPLLPIFVVRGAGPGPNAFPLPPPYGPRLNRYTTLLTTPVDPHLRHPPQPHRNPWVSWGDTHIVFSREALEFSLLTALVFLARAVAVFREGIFCLGIGRPVSGFLSARPTSPSKLQSKFSLGSGVHRASCGQQPDHRHLSGARSRSFTTTVASHLKRAASVVSATAPSMATSFSFAGLSRFIDSF
ncbi:Ste3-like pheromone receptor [Mycena venus]|uniref:Ste3-like pheromone receptor n=1 Tax=Mycena venus TaxID=2733690 RepID=A0A8H7CVI0_9AGAR|nr:Ste3-like pheromone receptor [Mycena venus]